ncbi:MAG: DUF6689 family protein [Lysobacterales bacterium]
MKTQAGLVGRAGRAVCLFLCSALLAGPALAEIMVLIPPAIPGSDDREVEIEICFPSLVECTIGGDFEIEFHHVENLTEAALGISATLLDSPAALAAVNARLPSGVVGYQLDPAFPILVTIEPPTTLGLAFEDDVDFEFHTDESLVFLPGSVYRLMKAPIGGAFRDITSDVLAGSIRTRGSGGRFSEFVIAKLVSTRASSTPLANVLGEATLGFADLDARLREPDLSLVARRILGIQLRIAHAAFDNGDYPAATAKIGEIEIEAANLRGEAIPNRWRAARDLVNAEGEIQALAAALKHKLRCLQNLCN